MHMQLHMPYLDTLVRSLFGSLSRSGSGGILFSLAMLGRNLTAAGCL